MPASESIFCFASSRIESHPCANRLAPMVFVQINSVCLGLDVRRFECFNCDNVDMIPERRAER
jgi:hypothetical protein